MSAPSVPRWRRLVVDTAPLRHPAYRRLWLSTVVTTVGAQLTAVAVPKQIFDDTGSSAWVGLSGLVALVPLAFFALWGGSIADAVDRRKMLLLTNAGIAATSFALFAQSALHNTQVWLVLVLLAVQQACFGLNSPARGAAIPRLVPAGELAAANALSATVFGLGAVLGPLLAGALIPVLGLSWLYLIDSVALLAALYAVFRLPAMPPTPREDGQRATTGLSSVIEGLRYISLHAVLLVSFLVDIIAMVFGMPRALFPELAERTFGDPPGGGIALGVLYAAIPAGAFAAGLFSGSFTRIRRHGQATAIAVMAWGAAIAAFGLSGNLWVAATFLALAGAADLVSMVFRGAILQTAATDEMRGRMQGVFFLVVAGGPRLADLLHGTVGDLVGTARTIVAGGLLVIVLTVLVVLRFPTFWRYRLGAEPPAVD
ncbi:MFS transporter [Angustibacter luteus]|uniref:MFS transporter n=1 Tax=Angustibacter luteus TaxID=658456 RepID=A0ABW1JBU8_9ACTN